MDLRLKETWLIDWLKDAPNLQVNLAVAECSRSQCVTALSKEYERPPRPNNAFMLTLRIVVYCRSASLSRLKVETVEKSKHENDQ